MRSNGERISEICEFFCKTKREFASKLGERPQTVSNWFSRDNGINVLNKVADAFPEVNKAWLITGEGKMLKKDAIEAVPHTEPELTDPYTENKHGETFYKVSDTNYIMTVPLVPYCAYGRFINECEELEPNKDEWEKESFIVDKIVHGNYMAFEVKGDSMDDGTRSSFEDGDIVLARELDRIHWRDGLKVNQRPYWVIVCKSSVLIKEVTEQNLETGEITCHSLSDSPEYSDFTLNFDEIKRLFYVLQKKPKAVHY